MAVKFFFHFIFTFLSLLCLGHGSQIGQAGALWAFQHRKVNSTTDEMWTTTSLDFDDANTFDNGGKMEDDVIKELPGQPAGVMFNQYAGYITVDKSKGRSLFYYFAEAAHNPSSKPLILWLNGGPGCSSLGIGAMIEIGPFGVNPDGQTLYSRAFAWNKVANTLFLESPAGVGFSYSNTTSDYALSGDKRTAQDTYTFLVNWFRRYLHYEEKDLYIIGESYAGFYIPELADLIIKKNKATNSTMIINLKGIMIGNGLMDLDNLKGVFDYLWSHALISDETYKELKLACSNSSSKQCNDVYKKHANESGNIDSFNIYAPVCLEGQKNIAQEGTYDPCESKYVKKYLNLHRVQKALHANVTKLPYPWSECSDIKTWNDRPSTMFPIYTRLIGAGLRILLYSGDVDSVVPVTSTRYSLNSMNLKVIKPWHFWSDDTKQVAGYKVVYNGLTFATVRYAGHEVPLFQPRRAMTLLKMFLANTGV